MLSGVEQSRAQEQKGNMICRNCHYGSPTLYKSSQGELSLNRNSSRRMILLRGKVEIGNSCIMRLTGLGALGS